MGSTQPSILGQQPVSVAASSSHPYPGSQFAPTQQVATPQPSAQWSSAVPAVHQSMNVQMHNPYMPPGTTHHQVGHGMMQLPGGPGQSGPSHTLYHPGNMQ